VSKLRGVGAERGEAERAKFRPVAVEAAPAPRCHCHSRNRTASLSVHACIDRTSRGSTVAFRHDARRERARRVSAALRVCSLCPLCLSVCTYEECHICPDDNLPCRLEEGDALRHDCGDGNGGTSCNPRSSGRNSGTTKGGMTGRARQADATVTLQTSGTHQPDNKIAPYLDQRFN
jgi:hypothetical protein